MASSDRYCPYSLTSAANLFQRVWGFKVSILSHVGSDVREATPSFSEKQLAESETEADSEDGITIVIEQTPLPHEHEIIIRDQEERSATMSFSRGGELLHEDVELLARIIHAEARGESFEGQVAVGAVVLNRVESPDFPMTIREVIYQPGQFTAVYDGQIRLAPNQTAFRAAQAALEGHDPSRGAIFYYNPRIATDQWIRTRTVILTIGNHDFCI